MGGKKGKKAWKKIDTQDVEAYLEKSTREERQGLAFEGIPDADLFFVDKAPEGASEPAAPAAAAADGKKGKKLTRAQAILLAAHSAKPVSAHVQRKHKGPLPVRGSHKRAQPGAGATAAGGKAGKGSGGGSKRQLEGEEAAAAPVFDLWVEEPHGPSAAAPAAGGALVSKRQRTGAASSSGHCREVARPAAPAVEIDLPGCSFNPDREQHQDAIAVAVAAEMQKVYRKDLEPVAPPLLVDYKPEQDELAGLLGGGEEGPEEEEGEGEGQEGSEGEGEGDGEAAAGRQQKAAERKTRKDRNRAKRRREEEEALAERRRLKAQRRELDRLGALQAELEERQHEQEAARLRRKLDRQERLAAEPPKLGKQRFEPAALQVLTSDEVTGSLRRLKPTAMLAKDRFKSLQKRGIIEPRKKVAKKAGRKVLYEQGARWEREKEGQQAINEARKRLKKKKKVQGEK